MANTPSIFITSGNQSVSFTSSSRYTVISGSTVRIGTDLPTAEANIQYTMRVAGVFSNLYVRCSSNAKAGAVGTVITFRKNLAAGNQTITIPPSTTGIFEDTTHTDSVSAGDEVTYQITFPAATGAQMFNIFSTTFLPSSDTAVSLLGYNSITVNLTTAVRYQGLEGLLDLTNATETNAQMKIQTACTLRYLFMNLVTNTTGIVTLRIRKNGVDGNSVAASATATTGLIEDVTNTDSIAAGDNVCYSLVANTSTGTRAVIIAGVSMLTTNNEFFLGAVDANNTEGVINFGVTNYLPIGGRPYRTTTENDTKLKTRVTKLELSKLTVNITANTVNNSSTVRTRINGANGNQSIPIPATTAGLFVDASNLDSNIISTDEINYQIVTGGTTGNMTLRSIGVIADSTPTVLYSYSPTEPATSVSDSIIKSKKAVRPISEPSITVGASSLTKTKKLIRTISEPSIVSNGGILSRQKKAFRTIPEPSTSVSDSITKLRKYFRSISNEGSISVSPSTLLRKVIRQVSEPAINSSSSIQRKITRNMSEPAITTTGGTIQRKVTRSVSEPGTSVIDIVQKKAYKNMSEPALGISDTLRIKVTRVISEPPISVSNSIPNRQKKSVRTINELSPITVSDSTKKKVTHNIADNVVIVGNDIADGHKRTSLTMNEGVITVGDSLVRMKRAVRNILEPATTIAADSIKKKAIKSINEPSIIVASGSISKKVTHFIANTVTVGVSSITRQKKAVRNIPEPATITGDSISKSAIKSRTINENPIPNIGDTVNSAKRLVRNISEPATINSSDVISRQGYFNRIIHETAVTVSDSLGKSKISGNEKHSFKVGQKFKSKKTNDTRLDYTDAKGAFSDSTEEFS